MAQDEKALSSVNQFEMVERLVQLAIDKKLIKIEPDTTKSVVVKNYSEWLKIHSDAFDVVRPDKRAK